MSLRSYVVLFFCWCIAVLQFNACRKDLPISDNLNNPIATPYNPTPYSITYPRVFKTPILIPSFNPLTVEGIALGRKLFYDPILSINGQISCSSCHNPEKAFTDSPKQFSDGVDNLKGVRNSMPLFNLGWYANYNLTNHRFFWDGGAPDLESQVIGPITNPIEMKESLFNVISKLKNHSEYPLLFKKAFGTDSITSQLLMYAIAQFERTLISGNSKYDQYKMGLASLTDAERTGMNVFLDETKGDCWHCHTLESGFFTDFTFKNNGTYNGNDSGLFRITGIATDLGKFKVPSLRNLVFTAPYMHDGRFGTLEAVVDFYVNDAYKGQNIDQLIAKHPAGLNLTVPEKFALVAFLKTLTDSSFVSNPAFQKP
jgi:cytochrome c peroxidase